jgi:mono/diheme cytochrome c family protein
MTWKPLRTMLATLAAASLFIGCPDGEEAATPAPTPEATPEATPEPTPEPTPEATPEAAFSSQLTEFLATVSADDKAKTNPKLGDEAAIAACKGEYNSVCFACHGKTGQGDGPAAGALTPRPGNLADPVLNAKLTDGDRFAIMKTGVAGTAMQAFGAALSDDQIWSILAYVATLRGDSEAPKDDESEAPNGDESEAPNGDESEAPNGDESEAPKDDESEAPKGDE